MGGVPTTCLSHREQGILEVKVAQCHGPLLKVK